MSEITVEPGQEGPVTVSISRRVKPGREADYEAWLHGIVEAGHPILLMRMRNRAIIVMRKS